MKNLNIKLDHINFSVANLDESIEWYKNVFHFELVEQGNGFEGQRWGILKNGDSMLAISENKDMEVNTGEKFHKMYHYGLRLVDKSEWLETVEKFNLEFSYPSPVNYPHSTSWYVNDPTGNQIEVAIWKNNEVIFDKPS